MLFRSKQKTACKCFTVSIPALIFKVLIEMNVIVSYEPIFSDFYRSANHTGSLAKIKEEVSF